jgi:nucleoside-diphosphate-sugar epimerase
VLVTGASGFLGGALVSRLLADGSRVRILVRSPDKASVLADRGVEVVVGDITDSDAVDAALDGVGVVFHLAGRLQVPGNDPDIYRSTHVDGTQLMIEHAQTQPRLTRFVHCSTTGVLGVTGDRPAAEDAPLAPTNLYEASKALAELRVRAAHRRGLPAVIVRPGLVYGPGDLHLVAFFDAVAKRRFRPIGRATVWMHPIYIDDMTEALLRCASSPDAIGDCFHIAGREPVSLAQLATEIAAATNSTPPTKHLPMGIARLVAAFGDALPDRLQRSAPLTRSRLHFLTHSRVYSVAKAERVLGFVARTELQDGIAKTVSWYREHGYLPTARARAQRNDVPNPLGPWDSARVEAPS